MKTLIAILVFWSTIAFGQTGFRTMYLCLDYPPTTNNIVFEYWANSDSKPGIPGWFMQGTNFEMRSTAWEISTNWYLFSRTTNKTIAVSNNGSNCLFIARAVDLNTGLASEWAGHSP